MGKKGYSVSMDPSERAEIEAAIERRRKSGDRRDRELDFSKWMREAIFEKLERDSEAEKKPALEFLPVKPAAADVPAANVPSTDSTRFSAGGEPAPRKRKPAGAAKVAAQEFRVGS
ncbi:MAG: hypothetical protein QOE70_4333 [Chthoniobacter sp.]|jgi:hypothetical protein|nr:hypothetical protein [Chthoniobacter sp.]